MLVDPRHPPARVECDAPRAVGRVHACQGGVGVTWASCSASASLRPTSHTCLSGKSDAYRYIERDLRPTPKCWEGKDPEKA
jgi:hypothetical protein